MRHGRGSGPGRRKEAWLNIGPSANGCPSGRLSSLESGAGTGTRFRGSRTDPARGDVMSLPRTDG